LRVIYKLILITIYYFIASSHGLEEPNQEVAALISHAVQERLKNLVEKLAVITEHRIDLIKVKFIEILKFIERERERGTLFILNVCISIHTDIIHRYQSIN